MRYSLYFATIFRAIPYLRLSVLTSVRHLAFTSNAPLLTPRPPATAAIVAAVDAFIDPEPLCELKLFDCNGTSSFSIPINEFDIQGGQKFSQTLTMKGGSVNILVGRTN